MSTHGHNVCFAEAPCCVFASGVGQDKGNLLEALKESNCWLQFLVKWKDWADDSHPDGTTWEDEDMLSCDELLFDFLQSVRQEKRVPFPGAPCTDDFAL